MRTLPLKPLIVPMISNTTAEPYETVEDTIDALVTNCSETALVKKSVEYLQKEGCAIFHDISQYKLMKTILKNNFAGHTRPLQYF